MKKTNRKVSKSTFKKTWKNIVRKIHGRGTKTCSVTRKKVTDSQRLDAIMNDVIKSSAKYKEVQDLLKKISQCEIQSRETTRLYLATLYCHINETFGNDDFEKGARKYLLCLFPSDVKDDKKKVINQSNRNKYNRAVKFLKNKGAPCDKIDEVMKMIEKFGLQIIYNGKENNNTKKVRPVKNFDDVIKEFAKDNGVDDTIRKTLSIAKEKEIDGDFIFCSINGKPYCLTNTNFMKEFVKFRKTYKKSLASKKK